MSVIPAQIQQLPGRDFEVAGPSAFEAVLGGVGSFMEAQSKLNQEREARRSNEMGQAFAAMISRGLIEPGKAPSDRQGFSYANSPFYYTQPGDPSRSLATASDQSSIAFNKARTKQILQKTGDVPQNDQARLNDLIEQNSKQAIILGKGDMVAGAKAAVQVSYAQLEEQRRLESERQKQAAGEDTTTAGDLEGEIQIQGKASDGSVRIIKVKKSDTAKIKSLLEAGGKVIG